MTYSVPTTWARPGSHLVMGGSKNGGSGRAMLTAGFHASLKVLDSFSSKFKALKVLENRAGA